MRPPSASAEHKGGGKTWSAPFSVLFFPWIAFGRSKFCHFGVVDGLEKGVSRRKVAAQSAGSHPCLSGHVVETGIRGGASEGLLSHFQDAFAILEGIGAGRETAFGRFVGIKRI
jgi:hypothetical protein